MKYAFIIMLMLLSSAMTGRAVIVTREKNPDGSKNIKVELPGYKVTVVDPATMPGAALCGARFCTGGWIRSIRLGDSPVDVLRTESVFDWHPTWGLAQEFIPAQLLKTLSEREQVYLQIGVGEVLRVDKDPFKDVILKRYHWKTSIELDNSTVSLVFSQHAPANACYRYSLTQRLTFTENRAIILKTTLENHNINRLLLETYLHPFFVTCSDTVVKIPGKFNFKINELHDYKQFAPLSDVFQVEAANLINNASLRIRSSLQLSKVVFWRAKNAFAIEPFVPIELSSGDRFICEFHISFDAQTKSN